MNEHVDAIKKLTEAMNTATDVALSSVQIAMKFDPEEPHKTLLLNLESAIEKIKKLQAVMEDNFDACNDALDAMDSEDATTAQYEANNGVSYKEMFEHLVPGRSSWRGNEYKPWL